MNSNKPNKYFAFISYKREDEEWAIWFHHELENYHLPISLNGRADLPTEFRPVFRDIDELKAGNLPEQIYNALASSAYLIVICSPNSAKSEWVNKEIRDFIEIGKTKGIDNVRNIFPFIVDGNPHAKIESEECFPQALLELAKDQERIGGNVNESGRDKAFIKVFAGMLPNVAFDDLWNRYEHDKAEEERLKREERERFLRIQSRLVAEKTMDITNDSCLAQLLALEVLPKNLKNPDRPYTVEAERALRQAASQHKELLIGHVQGINSLSFSADGKRMASASDDFTVRIWDVETGLLIRTLDSDFMFCKFAVFSPDGNTIVSAYSKALVVWDSNTGEPIQTFLSEKRMIDYLAFSHDGKKLALSSAGGDVVIMDISDGSIITTLSAHEDSVCSAVFSPDGKQVVSVSLDGAVVVWDLDEESYIELGITDEFGDGFYYAYATFSHDGNRIAYVLDNIIEVWDLKTNSLVQSIEAEQLFVSMSFCDDDKKIIAVFEDGELVIWDVETGREVSKIKGCSGEVSGAVFSKDFGRVGMIVDVNNIVISDINPNYIVKVLKDGDDTLTPEFCNHNEKQIIGKWIVSEGGNKTVEIWDLETGKPIKTLGTKTSSRTTTMSESKTKETAFGLMNYAGHLGLIKQQEETPAAFSQDGKYIVSSSTDGTLTVWDAESGGEVVAMTGHRDKINLVKFSPDGRQIISRSEDGTIIIWDFPPLQDLIDQTRDRFKDRPLTPEERRQYYLE